MTTTRSDHTPARRPRGRLLAAASAVVVAALAAQAGPAFATPAPAPVSASEPGGGSLTPEIVAGVHRIGGADRYEVSAAISADTYPTGTTVDTVYIVSGEGYADALSASALAGLAKSPVLLVKRDEVPDSIRFELSRLRPAHIHVLGGLNSVGTAAEMELRKFAPTLSRVEGADRYIVSAAATKYAMPGPAGARIVYVASGENFPDALSGAAAAGRVNGPVLLVRKDGVPDAVRAEIERLHPTEIRMLGGTSSISAETAAELNLIAPTGRIDGSDRYGTSALLAEPFPNPSDTVFVASGQTFPDALSGGAAAVVNKGPVLLVTSDSIPPLVGDQLTRLHPKRIVVLGGTSTIEPTVAEQLKGYLG